MFQQFTITGNSDKECAKDIMYVFGLIAKSCFGASVSLEATKLPEPDNNTLVLIVKAQEFNGVHADQMILAMKRLSIKLGFFNPRFVYDGQVSS